MFHSTSRFVALALTAVGLVACGDQSPDDSSPEAEWSRRRRDSGAINTGDSAAVDSGAPAPDSAIDSAVAADTATIDANVADTSTEPASPTAPQPYTVPSTAIVVSTTADFIREFTAGGVGKDIVLASGTYSNGGPVIAGGPHRIWAANVGSATLTFGVGLGGNATGSGAEIHGIRFDITNASYAQLGAAVNIWGAAGEHAKIQDSWLFGHNAVSAGVLTHSTNGFVAQRLVVNGFTDYGVFFETYYSSSWTDNPAFPPLIEDCDISAVYRSPRASANGTAEAGLWAGTKCTVNRVKITDCGWMGIWTGANCNDAVFSDLFIDNIYPTSVGIYVEHYTRRTVFRRFQIGPRVGSPKDSGHVMSSGVNTEWADPAYVGTNPVAGESLGGSHYSTFEDGTINSSNHGIATNDGENTTVARVKFVNQAYSGINEFRTSGTGYNTTWATLGNDFSGLAPGAVPYSTKYPH